MKRILFVLLMMTCSVSWAEWERSGKNKAFAYYVDKSTTRRSGAIAKMWMLSDFFEVQTNSAGKKYKSDKTRFAYNCLEETLVPIAMVQYSGSMGEGEVVWSDTRKESNWEWESVVPGSSGEVIFKMLCGKN